MEVEIDGKKQKTNKGSVQIEIKGHIIKDPDSKWDVSPFVRFIRDVYNKYIIPGKVEAIENIIFADVSKFKDEMKAFLELMGKR